MSARTKLLATFVLSALCATANAQEGLYVRGELGRSDIDATNIKDSSSLAGIDVGWRFTENFGVELGYRNLGKFKGTVTVPTDLKADAFTVALSGRANLHKGQAQGFFLDARFGIANPDTRGTEVFGTVTRRYRLSGARPFFSVGAGYDMTENFGMAFSYSRYQARREVSASVSAPARNVDIDFPALSVSAEFRFN
jgi:hypothetical protein